MPGPIFFRTAKTEGAYARSRLNRWLVAAAFTLAAAVVRWVLDPFIGLNFHWFVFFPAILFATFYGRFEAGVVAIGLSFILVAAFWMPAFSVNTIATIVIFLGAAFLSVWGADRALRATRDLELERKFFNIVLASASDRLAVLNSDWRYIFVDPAAREVTGKPPEELIGRTIWDAFPQLRESHFEKELIRCQRDRVPVYFEIHSPSDNRWLLFRARPIEDRNTVLYVADISARKHIEIDKDQAREQAAILERLVSERTARLQETVAELEHSSYTISHNLRAPLRAMEAFADFLARDYGSRLDVTGREYLNRIKTSAQHMDNLIGALLSYSRISMSDLPLASVNLDRLVETVVSDYVPDPKAVHISHPLGTVTANESLLAQAVSNLIENAVKFVPLGSKPQIDVLSEQHAEKLRLIVRDQGVGVPKEAGEKIFKSFERANEDYPGLGIGLSIVKRAANRMNGRAGFESNLGQGSSFWIELPEAGIEPPHSKPTEATGRSNGITTVQE
jgi:PAS domain S-box-containing protein